MISDVLSDAVEQINSYLEEYPESQKESSITQVLYDFIEYLKNKRKISKVFNFLRIKKKE